jgi:hypothetical protein
MAIWHAVGIPRPKISLAIMLTSALILTLNALAVYAIALKLSPESPLVSRVAMILAGTYWSLVQWSLEGFEVGLTALLSSLVVLQSFEYMETRRTRQLAVIAVCLVALAWTRLEMLAVAGIPVAYLLVVDGARVRVIKAVVMPVLAGVALLFAARYWYFGEWLPNTYYLKLTGVALTDRFFFGIRKIAVALVTHFSIVLVPIALLFAGIRRDHRILILMAVFAMGALYTAYIGGDTWERPFHANRFLSPLTPLLLAVALHLTNRRMARVRAAALMSPLVVGAVGIVMALGLSGLTFHKWLQDDIKKWNVFRMVELGEQFREQAPLDSRVAVVWAGAMPYFSRLYTIDLLGKSDKVIARSPPHDMSPGHNKWDYAYSIGVLKPDYIVQLWKPTAADIELIKKLGYSRSSGMYVRTARVGPQGPAAIAR